MATCVWDALEEVRAELEALGAELHMLSEHAVALDANFSKMCVLVGGGVS